MNAAKTLMAELMEERRQREADELYVPNIRRRNYLPVPTVVHHAKSSYTPNCAYNLM
jgi:hypothetical protein